MPDKILFCNELKINALHSIIAQFGNIKVNKCRNVGNFFPIILRGCSDFESGRVSEIRNPISELY